MTKPILAAATMMLAEDDVLELDEPVDRLLPELANRRPASPWRTSYRPASSSLSV